LRMEQFFTPTQRLQEISPTSPAPRGYTEVELTQPIEAFSNHPWDWSDFRAFATDAVDGNQMWKIMWLTEDTLIWVENVNTSMGDDFLRHHAIQRATFTSLLNSERSVLVLAKPRMSSSLPASVSRIFRHAVITSNCFKLRVSHLRSLMGIWHCPDLLKLWEIPPLELLKFEGITFKEAHCRALATLHKRGLRVAFHKCNFFADGAEGALTEWLRHSEVVHKLKFCSMDDNVVSALSGNSSVKSLSIGPSIDINCQSNFCSLAKALVHNKGIESLYVGTQGVSLSDQMVDLLLRSLLEHPRLESLSLDFNGGSDISALSKTRILKILLRFVQSNTVVKTIDLFSNDGFDEEYFQTFIVPRLVMNRNYFEDQRRALARADPSIRGKLLGRALNVFQCNPDLLFRFLSENVPAFVRSDKDDPNIPTSTGQKRKSRP
jgi:hypothetical protein